MKQGSGPRELKKVRVLHIFHELKYSGAEIMYCDAARLFSENGVEFIAISTAPEYGEFRHVLNENGIVTHHWPTGGDTEVCSLVKFYIRLYRYIRDEEIDVIHVHRHDLYWPAFVARIAGKRCIKTMHAYLRSRTWYIYVCRWLQRRIARHGFGMVTHAIGMSVRENEREYYGNKTVQINNWFNEDHFYPARGVEERNRLRHELGLEPEVFAIVSVGSCDCNKNHHAILQAMKRLVGRIPCQYLHLGSGPTEEDEKRLAKELGLGAETTFLGKRRNVRDYLVAADVFVMTSGREGLSIAALEAMACGITAVMYDSPGLRELVVPGGGLLVNHGSEALAFALTWCAENREAARAMGERGRRFVNEQYGMRQAVEKLSELYRA